MSRATAAEVVVIGGGPAGAAACVALGQLGRRPLWLAPPPPAEKIGESLSPAARPVLASLGLGHLLESPAHRPANDTFSAWGTERLVERSAAVRLGGAGLVLDRPAFERELRDAAIAAGAHLLASPLQGFAAGAAGWHLTLEGGAQATACFLIDCSGRKALVARRFARRCTADRLMAAYSFLEQQDRSVEPTPATLIEAVAGGWWYASLLPQQDGGRPRLAVARFTDADLQPRGLRGDARRWRQLVAETRYLSRWIESAGFAVEAPPRAASAASLWLEAPGGLRGGCGWVAAGDAAAAFDPLSSHGLTTALWSGRQAAQAAHAALEGEPRLLEAYGEQLRRGVALFQSERARAYAAEQRFCDLPFWRRRQA